MRNITKCQTKATSKISKGVIASVPDCRNMAGRRLLLFALTTCFAFHLAQAQKAEPDVTRTANYVAKFETTNKATVENSLIFDNGTDVGVATASPEATLDVNGTVNSASGYSLGEQPFAFGSFANANGFFGFGGNSTLTGTANTAVGWEALQNVTTGNWNEAIGGQALQDDTTGHSNAAVGLLALVANTTGNYNAALGNRSLEGNTTGSYNVGLGYFSAIQNTTGSFNIGIGYYGGQTIDNSPLTGSNDTGLGSGAGLSTGTLSNATALGSNAVVSESNALVLGCISGINYCSGTVSVGIATSSPTNILTIGQGFGAAIADGWNVYSSRRWKTNIQTLHGALDKVEHLRGVSYDSKDTGKHQIGVIAEEVGAVIPEVVTWETNGEDARGVDYARLTALLIEATKEQQTLIREQQDQLKLQQAQIENLTHQVSTIQTVLQQNGQQGSIVLSASAGMPSVH